MEPTEVKISTKKYAQLLQTAYQQVKLAENPKAYRITRLVYFLGILICFLLARSLPEYRQILGIAILLMGVFLLSSSVRYNIKKRQQKKAKQPFDQMLYQITEISSFIFELAGASLTISLQKKDDSTRQLNFDIDSLTAFQRMKGGFLISNEEGIDFIIPDGLFENEIHHKFLQLAEQNFQN